MTYYITYNVCDNLINSIVWLFWQTINVALYHYSEELKTLNHSLSHSLFLSSK